MQKSSSSGGNKSEEEKTSKGQEGREINTTSWSSNGKTKNGEYVLSQPPKKSGGKEVGEVDKYNNNCVMCDSLNL